MEVKINREIRNYTESMFFGLSLRQFIFSVLACGVAVGLYFLLKPHLGTETVSEFLMPKKLVFHSTNTYLGLMIQSIEKKTKEAYKNND